MSVLKAINSVLSGFLRSSLFVEKSEPCASWWFRFTVSAHVASYLSRETYFLCEDPQTCAELFLFASLIRTVVNSLSTGLLTGSFSRTRTHTDTHPLPSRSAHRAPPIVGRCVGWRRTRRVRTDKRNFFFFFNLLIFLRGGGDLAA